ncbi:unnamed protein product [Closterium sp. NIES-53]
MHLCRYACGEFVSALASYLQGRQLADVQASPWYGLSFDESTNRTHGKHMIMYVHFERNEQTEVQFFSNIPVDKADGASLYASITAHLDSKGLSLDKLAGVSTDGAKVIWEALAAKDAAKKFPDFNVIDPHIRKTAEHIGRSSISRDAFMQLQDVVMKTQLEVQSIFDVRWLSRGDAVARFCEVLPILLWLWHEEDQAAYKIGTSFKFQFMLFFLADVLEMLNTLNMAFQRLVVDIGEVKLLVDKLKLKLAQRYVENRADYGTPKSKHLHAFLEKHGSPDKREITIRGLEKQGTASTIKDILHENPIGKDKKTDLDSCIKLGQEFAQELIAKLDYRLGDVKHFDGAKFFMPMHYPPRPADREGWLNVHLYELLDMFKEKLPGT